MAATSPVDIHAMPVSAATCDRATLPRISVVVPSYNQAAFLERTLESLIAQKYPDLEVLVADGGSADGSREILRRHEAALTWWVSEKDAGQADAINKGFRRASGDILTWLNSDDVHCAGALFAVAEFFRANPRCDAVVGDLEIIDARDQLMDVKKAVPVPRRWNIYSGCAVPQPATFFTRRAFERTGELDATLHFQMDYEFFLRMQARGNRFGVLRRPLARFRLHDSSKTVAEYDREFWRDFATIQDRYLPAPWSVTSRTWRRAGMKFLTRLEMFAARALLRGVWRPHRYSRVRRSVFAPS